jgi:hypothetical protein
VAPKSGATVSLIRELLRLYSRRRERLKQIRGKLRREAAEHAKRALRKYNRLDEETERITDDTEDEWFELRLIGRTLVRAPRSKRARLLEALPVSVSNDIRGRMWEFADLQIMNGPDVQRVLREVDARTLAAALADVPEELRQLIYRNLSSRARVIVSEEQEYLGEIDDGDIGEAQQAVADVIGRLVDRGDIALLQSDDGPGQ